MLMLSIRVRHAAAAAALITFVALSARPSDAAPGPQSQPTSRATSRQIPTPELQSQPSVIVDAPDANRSREELMRLLQKYPPALGRVLKLDPSLLSKPDYLA